MKNAFSNTIFAILLTAFSLHAQTPEKPKEVPLPPTKYELQYFRPDSIVLTEIKFNRVKDNDYPQEVKTKVRFKSESEIVNSVQSLRDQSEQAARASSELIYFSTELNKEYMRIKEKIPPAESGNK